MKNKIKRASKNSIFKYNSGQGAILCNLCSCIIKTGKDFTEEEKKASRGETKLGQSFCEDCKLDIMKFKLDDLING